MLAIASCRFQLLSQLCPLTKMLFSKFLTTTFLKLTGATLFLLTTGETAGAIVVSGDPNSDSNTNAVFPGPPFDPNDPFYRVTPGESDPLSGISLDGVSDLIIDGSTRCTGSRIGSNLVLTAAHCVTNNSGQIDASTVQATWETANGDFTLSSQTINVHPLWNGDLADGADIAVIEMIQDIASSVPTYDLFFDRNEIGQTFTKVGYGRSGNGIDGDIGSLGTKRQGQNIYDETGQFFESINVNDEGVLLFDFDDGTNNTFGNSGIGFQEINSAPGDSGGPTFINGLIAGVTSFGTTLESEDIDGTTNSTFGEISGDARVSEYRNFIESFDSTPVPFDLNKSLAFLFLGGFLTARQFFKHWKQ